MTYINNRNGFTLIEIILALAIVIAIGAIISLSLSERVSTAKIRSDIQSTRVLQSAIDLYEAEFQTPVLTKTNTETDFRYLVEKNYIKNSAIKPQSSGKWVYRRQKLYLEIDVNDAVQKVLDGLTDDEKSLINPGG